MKMLTLPISGFWVVCGEDTDLNEEFGAGQFSAADEYLNKSRKEHPDMAFELIANLSA